MAVAFDEMNIPGGDLRPAYQEAGALAQGDASEALEYRRQEAELLFRRIGITFAVYGEAESTERLIPSTSSRGSCPARNGRCWKRA